MALYHGGRFDVDYRSGEESLDAFCLRRQDVYQRSFTFYFILFDLDLFGISNIELTKLFRVGTWCKMDQTSGQYGFMIAHDIG